MLKHEKKQKNEMPQVFAALYPSYRNAVLIISALLIDFFTCPCKDVIICLPESSRAATHDFTLANKLGIELRSIEREVNVEVDTVEGALWGIHTFKVFFEVLS